MPTTEIYNLSAAAKEIGISRPTLYQYLDRPQFLPTVIAGHPTLSRAQVEMIKIERRGGEAPNGKRKNGHKVAKS